jgi:hypothetical protein
MKQTEMADAEWRKISHVYEGYSSDEFAVMYDLFMDAYMRGAEAEREACAKAVENHALGYAEPVWAFKLIDTIRARGAHQNT